MAEAGGSQQVWTCSQPRRRADTLLTVHRSLVRDVLPAKQTDPWGPYISLEMMAEAGGSQQVSTHSQPRRRADTLLTVHHSLVRYVLPAMQTAQCGP